MSELDNEKYLTHVAILVTILAWQYIIVFTEGPHGAHDFLISCVAIFTLLRFRETIHWGKLSICIAGLIIGAALTAIIGAILSTLASVDIVSAETRDYIRSLYNRSEYDLDIFDASAFILSFVSILALYFTLKRKRP